MPKDVLQAVGTAIQETIHDEDGAVQNALFEVEGVDVVNVYNLGPNDTKLEINFKDGTHRYLLVSVSWM